MEFTKEDYIKLYRNLVLARKADEYIIDGMKTGKIRSFYHSGYGQEAQGVGSCTFLRRDDYLMPNHRGVGHILSKGMSLPKLLAEFYGRTNGYSQGRGGHHFADPEVGINGLSGSIGGCFPIAAGMGIAAQMNGRGQVVLCPFGDGASNRGTLHEAFNLSALWKLPIVWLCENNGWQMSLRTKDAVPTEDIAALASGYNMPSVVIDGNDVIAVAEVTLQAVEKAREGHGPAFIECKTFRLSGHGIGDQAKYMDAAEVEAAVQKEPLRRYTVQLKERGILTDDDITRIDREVEAEVTAAVAFADAGPLPKAEDAFLQLYED